MKKTLAFLIVGFFLATMASAWADLPKIPGTSGGYGSPYSGYYHSMGCMATCPHGTCTWVKDPMSQDWGVCYCSLSGYPQCHTSSLGKVSYMLRVDRNTAAANLATMSQVVGAQMGPSPGVFDLQDSLVNLSNEVLAGDDASYEAAITDLEDVLGGMTENQRQQVHQIAVSILGPGLTP